jgi:hypothetical protein
MMKRSVVIAGALTAIGIATLALIRRPDAAPKPWQTTDVWYHESDVAQLHRTGRPQLVEFFHPD